MIASEFLPQAAIEDVEFDSLLQATMQFEEAARALELEDWIVQRLRHPEREATVNLVLVRDNGQAAGFTAFRVQHSTARGPTLGGIRLSPHAQLSDIRALALQMTWQCALLDVPFGGASGAIVCEPGKLSERELRRVSKDYVQALHGILGPNQDVLMEDLGSNPTVLSWMLDAYARAAGHFEPGAVTGKPPVLFGLPDHADATARGVLELVLLALASQRHSLAGARVALQGFGQVGAAMAHLLDEAGVRFVAIADISGGLRRDDGIAVSKLLEWNTANRVLFGYPEAEAVPNADVLQAECDVLILAAAPRQVTHQNAARIRTPLVIEVTPGGVTNEAATILEEHGTTIVPSILASAGATAAAYLEWSRNLGHEGFLLDGVEENVRLYIETAYNTARQAAAQDGLSLRRGAMLAAVEKVGAALRLR